MEGISQEASTLAGHLQLSKLTLLWDDNGVTIDGKPFTDLPAARRRGLVGYLPQDTLLFSGSLRQNIAFDPAGLRGEDGFPSRALRLAALEDDVAGFPHGLDTEIGESGIRISGGQRQRLGLARALLRDASLLVLDEPTVHLDAVAARRVADTVEELRASRTIVLVTHDRDLAARADRAVRLDAGRRVDPCCGD